MEPLPTTCGYFIERKKRHCRMTVRVGERFCGEHGPGPRVPCPIDKKHSCLADNLDKHVRKCLANRVPGPDYIVPAVNSASATEPTENCSLADLTDLELKELLELITNTCAELPPYESSILCHETLSSALAAPDCGVKARKHLLQNASLLANLDHYGLLKDNTTFVEFGAGRGQLSFYVGSVLAKKDGCHLLLIDRASTRHKLDNKLKDCAGLGITRVRADIADFELARLVPAASSVVGLCKHLCGEATDLALQCLLRAVDAKVSVSAVMLAPCCHHRCTWTNFLGHEFLEKWGFAPRIFTALCGITSWATCGSGRPRGSADHPDERKPRLGLNYDSRESYGHKAKMILNYARLKHIETRGFKGWLCCYIEQAVSPENVCFIAIPNNGEFKNITA